MIMLGLILQPNLRATEKLAYISAPLVSMRISWQKSEFVVGSFFCGRWKYSG